MEEVTADLILRLQLEDIEALLPGSETSDDQVISSDNDLALSLYREELATRARVLSDRDLGRTLDQAGHDTRHALAAPEIGTVPEADLISRLVGIGSATPTTERSRELDAPDVHLHQVNIPSETDAEPYPLDQNEPKDVSSTNDALFTSIASPVQTFARRPRVKKISRGRVGVRFVLLQRHLHDKQVVEAAQTTKQDGDEGTVSLLPGEECVACREACRELLKAPCSHLYCSRCTTQWFEAASLDESLFPVRCCQEEITLSLARDFLPEELSRRYELKAVEFSSMNRIYCPNPTCSAFTPPDSIQNDIVTCNACSGQSCTYCKATSMRVHVPRRMRKCKYSSTLQRKQDGKLALGVETWWSSS